VRYAADRKEKTRAKILRAAGRVFRREGYRAAGVDTVMAEAGLTAGGFYAHFESKQALLAEALAHAAREVGGRAPAATDGLSGREWVRTFLMRYLSLDHCREVEQGCPLAALVSEVARADESVKRSFEAIVRELVNDVASHAPGQDSSRRDARVLAALAMCLGGLGLARSIRDEAFAQKILSSCREFAVELLCGKENADAKVVDRRRRVSSPRSGQG
jgi:TetR/AcrR family transcriptional regulator, transcriptional repressor for nem operon